MKTFKIRVVDNLAFGLISTDQVHNFVRTDGTYDVFKLHEDGSESQVYEEDIINEDAVYVIELGFLGIPTTNELMNSFLKDEL